MKQNVKADVAPASVGSTKPLAGNVILWTEPDHFDRSSLINALKGATKPIQDAYKLCRWNGADLTCDGNMDREHWRNLYFYLSGYGDAQFECEGKFRRQPPGIPCGPEKQDAPAECGQHTPTPRDGSALNWLVVNPDGKLLAILDSESEAYWFTRNRGHADGAVFFRASCDYAAAPMLVESCRAMLHYFDSPNESLCANDAYAAADKARAALAQAQKEAQ